MYEFINFFLGNLQPYGDIYLLAGLLLSICVIDSTINLFRSLFRLGGR